MSFDLCQVRKASKPYYIENISTNIYTIEELCFYLYNNPCLIDGTIVNELLCDWLRDELGLAKLYRVMYQQLDSDDGTAFFIMPIFREIGYLSADEMRAYQEELQRLEVQPSEMKDKMKGDYLIKCGMYSSAIRQYTKMLEHQSPGNLGSPFYAQVWNNLGCAYARQFMFEEASSCFLKAWELSRTKETLRKYVSTLPLYLSEEGYRKKMNELGAQEELIGKIQEYNASIARRVEKDVGRGCGEKSPREQLSDLKEEYRRHSGV